MHVNFSEYQYLVIIKFPVRHTDMALVGKIEKQIEIEVPAEKFYHIWKKQSYQVPTASPANIKAVDVHEGEWHHHGSVKLWTYSVGNELSNPVL